MIANYVKTAGRNLTKNKFYSAINVSGLAIGMALAMLTGLWVWDEWSFNTYHRNYHHLARVMTKETKDGQTRYRKSVSYPLANELKTHYSTVFKEVLIARPEQEEIVSVNETRLAKVGQFIDPQAPDMLSLHMLAGTRAALQDPYSVILSASTAQALFGPQDPMGKLLKLNNTTDVRVTGIYEDLPKNSDFHRVNFFSPWALYALTNPRVKDRDWNDNFLWVYVQLDPSQELDQANVRIKDAKLNHIKGLAGMTEQVASQPQVFLLPMRDWHLYGNFSDKGVDQGPARLVGLVGLIGGVVLLLACVNFMNLSTARAQQRAKEVGVRKAIGSLRVQLIGQFLAESLLVAGIAFGLALLLATLCLPWFNDLTDKTITMQWSNPYVWLIGVGFTFVTGLLAGSYPALYLSSFDAIKVLKGTFRVGRFAAMPRQVLVMVQFTVSIALISGTLIIYRQVQFAKDRPSGYQQAGLLLTEMKTADFNGTFDVLRRELKNTGVVAEVAESSGQLTEAYLYSNNSGFSWPGKDPALVPDFGTLSVSPTYGKTVGWQLVAGRDFDANSTSDSNALIINEVAAKFMGLTRPVGAIIHWDRGEQKKEQYQVIGVIKNMVLTSPYDPIQPITYRLEGYCNWLNIRINPGVSSHQALTDIEAVFKRIVPAAPFDYKFADQEYNLKFDTEQRIGTLIGLLAGFAIFISGLGMFGLASFMAEQRTKEIGVRKVLGASVANLSQLLIKDFVVLVLIASLLAIPIAYYFMKEWLQHYTYRTPLSWWIFAVAMVGAVVITLVSVSLQAMKAALRNPVTSLRRE